MYRRKIYIKRLYIAENKPVSSKLKDESHVGGYALKPGLITSKIEEAMRRLGRKKVEECDGIPPEFLHALSGEPLNQLAKMCKKSYEKGVWPSDFKKVY